MKLPEEKISIIGNVGSGKTCFFAGLKWLSSATNASDFTISAEGPVKKYLQGLHSALNRRELPAATNSGVFSELKFNVIFRNFVFDVVAQDSAGEDFRRYSLDGDTDSPIFKRLIESNTILIFLDCKRDILTATDPERLDAVLDALSLEKVRGKGKKLGILLTKADLISDDQRSLGAEKFSKEKQPALYKKIKQLGFSTKFFFIAPLGTNDLKSDGPRPFGYQEIFEWISNNRAVRQYKPRLFAIVIALVALCIIGVFTIIDDREKQKQQSRLEKRVENVEKGIERWSTTKCEDELTLSRDFDFDNLPPAKHEKYNKTVDAIFEKIDKNTAREVESADHIEDAENAYNRLLAKHPEGSFPLTKKALASKTDKHWARERLSIHGMSLTNKNELEHKLRRVEGFKYRNAQDKENAQRAVKDVRRLMSGVPFSITIKGGCELKGERKTHVKVSLANKEFKTKTVDMVTPRWDEKFTNFNWSINFSDDKLNGDSIGVTWRWDYCGDIARQKYHGAFAFLDFLSSQKMDTVHGFFSDDRPLTITVLCEEFPNPVETKENIKKFVFPGTYFEK